ncbi:hypothetical protein VPH35_002415 [Triticum aestivum]
MPYSLPSQISTFHPCYNPISVCSFYLEKVASQEHPRGGEGEQGVEVVGSGLLVLRYHGRGWGGVVGQPAKLEKLHGARATVGRADGQPARRAGGSNALDGCRGDRP